MEDSLNAMTPKTQVIPKMGMTAPNVFVADLSFVNKMDLQITVVFFGSRYFL